MPNAQPISDQNLNVPNALSSLRFVLAAVVCGLIEWQFFLAAMIIFLIAASTDWIDGWWARKYNQVTKLGRILDPFVDKIIICGAMIALVGNSESGLLPWMATIVVGRELLVTSIRGMVEGQGGDFSANQLGKWKMLVQCAAIVAILLSLYLTEVPPWLFFTRTALIWSTLVITIWSGLVYVMAVVRPPQKTNL
jgi:CDP-diacylglycerol--glycerol-3-phosphate 3-phosphatidyltransferase